MTAFQDSPGVVPYPPEVVAEHLAAGTWGTDRIEDLVAAAARVSPDATAVVDATGRTTYAELLERVGRTAADLAADGVREGTTVVLQLPGSVDLVAVVLALFRLGARPVLALPAHRAQEISHVARTGRATHWIVGDLDGPGGAADLTDLTGRVHAALGSTGLRVLHRPAGTVPRSEQPHPVRPDADAGELAFFQLSGGTTGPAKLIPRAHREYAYSFLRSNELCAVDTATVMLVPLPATHNFPLSSPGWFGVLAAGGSVVFPPSSDAATVLAAVTEHRVTHVVAVPPLVQLWLDSPDLATADTSSLRRVLVGGARLSPAVARRVLDDLGPLQQVYGMAEGLVCYTSPDDPVDLLVESQGRPMSALDEVRVVDATGAEVPAGETGELLVRGPYTIRGYYAPGTDDPAAAPVNLGAFAADGSYRTGDLVRRSADGSLRVVGRVKEQVNRGGEKISPAEVEDLLLTHDAVHDVCVVGEPDERLGERSVAYVVPRPGRRGALDRRTLRRHLTGASLAAYKVPDVFRIVDDLPATAVGKVSRRGTRDRAGRSEVLDVVGVGFGPANIALAAALAEQAQDDRRAGRDPLRARFFEAAPEQRWHAGMLLPDASMQIAFAKDLATFRNPRSEFTFLQFLAERDGLADFFNRGSMTPLRVEFAAYLRWAAAKLDDVVRYGSRVELVRPVLEGGVLQHFEVTVADADGVTRVLARDVVLAAGLQPVLPTGVVASDRVWHTAEHLHRVGDVDPGSVRAVAVVGGGQSAAEVLADLHGRFPCARLHSVQSRFGLSPSDSSPFANRIFDAASVDALFDAPVAERDRIDDLHRGTNNAVVNPETLQRLYDLDYTDRWTGPGRFAWHRAARLVDVRGTADGLDVGIREGLTGRTERLAVDLVVCGTGYRPLDPAALLGDDADLLVRDERSRLLATRDYAARWNVPARGRLFLVGSTGHQHGISATLLSNVAVRAGEIAAALRSGAAAVPGPALVAEPSP
ncbi:SidA/IucD/PvdA family monooxygenase [Kineococcus endophyticus]|uniref:L-lysine N6-monooxygenase MbtG n=1 Tax=Kineococcus endophyticus TaxID=1181883 RepID=A0ABV3PCA0_9ACTN